MNKMVSYGCEGLVALISGGTSGIGLAVAGLLLREGAKVYIAGRSLQKGQEAVSLLEKNTSRRAVFIPCDVAKISQCSELMSRIAQVEGRRDFKLDILINSAGIYKEQRLEQISEVDYDKLMGVNVKGTLFLTQCALPYLAEGASIVNIASDAAISGNYGCPLYCASKGAVVALTKALALDLAPKIRVNCVCPADVDTPLLAKQLEDAGGSYTKEEMAAVYPLKRIAKASEIAHVILSLISPANSFMTGSVVTVDGGLTAG